LLLHDAGSSSRSLESVARELAEAGLGDGAVRRQVFLVDLPGHGETGALHLENFSADALAQLLWGVVGRLEIDELDIVALGASCFVATAMRSSCVTDPVRPAALNNVVLIDPWLFEDAERQTMLERYTPDLSPGDFGQHLLEAWYFARDGELFWPWNSPLVNNALERAPEILPAQIQARATDVIKAGPEFHRLVRDLLAYDFAGMLASAGSSNGPIRICARQGNGHEKRARRVAEIAAARYSELPARLADWPPVLAAVLSDDADTLD
jgi:pimeloyl-ACP methyl ester carboxylesterase